MTFLWICVSSNNVLQYVASEIVVAQLNLSVYVDSAVITEVCLGELVNFISLFFWNTMVTGR